MVIRDVSDEDIMRIGCVLCTECQRRDLDGQESITHLVYEPGL